MIDELPTRAAMTMAAFLLLATGLSLLGLFGADAGREAAQALADHLSRQIDALAATDASVTVRGGVGVPGPLELPPTLAGSSYRIEFRARDVRVLVGGLLAVSVARTPLHPFALDQPSYTTAQLLDRDAAVLEVRPGEGLLLERALRSVDGKPTYLTSVHLP